MRLLFPILIVSLLFTTKLTAQADNESSTIGVIRVEGTIGPNTFTYFDRALKESIDEGHDLFVMELDTPGGLLTSTQDIVKIMLNSSMPIVVFVSPEGANAGSAGTFITMAAHVAAMAPTTTIGAASPVSMGGAASPDTVMQKKLFNFTENFIQNIAEKRDRNADWAITAVRDGKALTAEEALEQNVVDLIAADREALIRELNGMEVAGQILNTEDAEVLFIEQSLAEKFFRIILRPEVILILTLISIYGIVGEITNPGTIVPGMAGLIALILLLYGVAALPLNIAGFLLIGLSVILFILEAFTTSFGILTAGGAISFFLGSMMVFQDLPESMQISWYWLVPATILTVVFFGLIATAGIKAQFSAHYTGMESWIGREALVTDKVGPDKGRVEIAGEYWNARSATEIEENHHCRIESVKGLTLYVEPITTETE
ncbi:nodulation protein NfeD [Balneola sp. MJW-20]|uniref:NfeD family protein n=1 Tax=Gracilimonas aurantiaca TaxID=3234185 RepID=UPI00346599D3